MLYFFAAFLTSKNELHNSIKDLEYSFRTSCCAKCWIQYFFQTVHFNKFKTECANQLFIEYVSGKMHVDWWLQVKVRQWRDGSLCISDTTLKVINQYEADCFESTRHLSINCHDVVCYAVFVIDRFERKKMLTSKLPWITWCFVGNIPKTE